MSKKQTAVEILYGEMASILNYEVDPVTALKIFDIYKQAKEMEKEQIDDLEYCIFIIDTKVDDFTLLQSDIERLNKMRDTYGE